MKLIQALRNAKTGTDSLEGDLCPEELYVELFNSHPHDIDFSTFYEEGKVKAWFVDSWVCTDTEYKVSSQDELEKLLSALEVLKNYVQ